MLRYDITAFGYISSIYFGEKRGNDVASKLRNKLKYIVQSPLIYIIHTTWLFETISIFSI